MQCALATRLGARGSVYKRAREVCNSNPPAARPHLDSTTWICSAQSLRSTSRTSRPSMRSSSSSTTARDSTASWHDRRHGPKARSSGIDARVLTMTTEDAVSGALPLHCVPQMSPSLPIFPADLSRIDDSDDSTPIRTHARDDPLYASGSAPPSFTGFLFPLSPWAAINPY